MARVAVTPIKVASPYGAGPGAGVAEKKADATEFNSFVNDGKTFLIVRNENAATKTLKLKTASGVQVGSTWAVPASKTIVVGPFPVFEQFGEVVNVDAGSAELTLIVISHPQFASAVR